MKNELKSGSYDQQDRSLTVMIPRAKYHPHPTATPFLSIEALDRRKSNASSNEAKLLSYLDVGVAANHVYNKIYIIKQCYNRHRILKYLCLTVSAEQKEFESVHCREKYSS